MKKIIWQTRSQLVADSIRSGKISPDANGGNAYDIHAAEVIAKDFHLEVSQEAILRKEDSILKYWQRMRAHSPKADLIIGEPYPIVFRSRSSDIPYVGMIHHIDDKLSRSSWKHRWYFNRLKRRLKGLDLIITVSGFWKEYLEDIGCKNVKVIYNAFDPQDYKVSEAEILKFRKENNLHSGKKLIYAGNATRQKGVYDVYEELKSKDFQLLMSGSHNQAQDLPVQYLHLGRRDYIIMLHACDLVITMSRMTEGWNRIAHEALLCGTPVIGSGVGGMKELLNGAGQQIVTEKSKLPEVVEEVLLRSTWYAENGMKFASQFDLNYFRKEWKTTLDELTK